MKLSVSQELLVLKAIHKELHLFGGAGGRGWHLSIENATDPLVNAIYNSWTIAGKVAGPMRSLRLIFTKQLIFA